MATVPWIGIIAFFLIVMNIMSYGTAIALPVLIVFGLSLYMAFERLVVLERCGFRCKDCGYDLRGQVKPSCPECGMTFDDDEIAKMQLANPEAMTERTQHYKGIAKGIGIGLAILVGVLLVLQGITIYRLRASSPIEISETAAVLRDVESYAKKNDGRAPRHAIEHGYTELPRSGDFIASGSATKPAAIPMGESTLAQFEVQSPDQRIALAGELIEALDPNIIAHRFGDYVFTYHGMDFNHADPALWIVIRWPDPGQNPSLQARDPIYIGLADGRIQQVTLADFRGELSDQNTLRATHDLPPLPDPSIITHESPAVEDDS